MRVRLLSIVIPGAIVGAFGCSSDGHHPPDDEAYNCADDTRGEEFVVGLEKVGTSGALDFRLMSADPAPPARGNNTWILQLHKMSGTTVGEPLTGATILVTPFMPDHQHGTGIPVTIEELTEPGKYKLTPVNMWMSGVWETTIRVTSAGGNDSAVYTFCLPS